MMMENSKFAGYDVELRPIQGNTDVLISCKGVLGLYSQTRKWEENGRVKADFGIRGTQCSIEVPISQPNNIRIGCLTGTEKEYKALKIKCKKLINKF